MSLAQDVRDIFWLIGRTIRFLIALGLVGLVIFLTLAVWGMSLG